MGDTEIQLFLGGYQCKLFDDPEKFLESYKGSHLLPWNGENSLMIDRFDCRNFLTNLQIYEQDNVKYENQNSSSQSEEDVMCEYERYLELHVDVQEENTLAEENNKRYNENINGFAAVKFTYDSEEKQTPESDNSPTTINDDKVVQEKQEDEADLTPYILPHDLVMPKEYILPKSEKQATVIEKTAAFIARQGVQMEIVLKTRQADNVQFAFLEHDNELNPFYKEMTRLIRIGMYIPRRFIPYNNNNNGNDKTSSTDKDKGTESEIKLPKVDISGTSYAALINRFKSKAAEKNQPASSDNSRPNSTPSDDDKRWQEKYQQLYKHYYDYYHKHYLAAFNNDENSPELAEKATQDAMTAAQAATLAIKRSETEPIENLQEGMTSDQCVIIDKMAEYVAKNGTEFETVVYSQKGSNPQFAFLQPIHKYHAFYLAKRKCYQITMASSIVRNGSSESLKEKPSENHTQTSTVPVKKIDCFKINIKSELKLSPEKEPPKKEPTGLVTYDSDSDSDIELHPTLLGSSSDLNGKSESSSTAISSTKETSPSSTLKMALMQVNQMSILHNTTKDNLHLINKVKPPLTALITNPNLPLLKTSSKLKKSKDKSPRESRKHHKKSRSSHKSRSPKRPRTSSSSPKEGQKSPSRRRKSPVSPSRSKRNKSPTSQSKRRKSPKPSSPSRHRHQKSLKSKIYETTINVPISPEEFEKEKKISHEESIQLQLERKQKAAAFFARLKKESKTDLDKPASESSHEIPGNVPAAVIALMNKNYSNTKPISYLSGANILENSPPPTSVPLAIIKAFPEKSYNSPYIRNNAPPEAYSDQNNKSSKKSPRKSSRKQRSRSNSHRKSPSHSSHRRK